ncbi:flagellar biosynthetic protein FliR [Sulfitobacter sabulilitoris]|uniref:Flagellar biosynthetic protein FliR n=1 Tax=Sulfitobacter sabulilitoris TaxID=2562655 RepID=A0A5S3PGR3_9RHOB|nr:flagellar biosynthetic protein FliR [Sulfitobacter sabulilitoris]TMM52501.1 flagellar biosynthetic protein FliR [Sulfitobacter sabulilitoris]
MTPLADLTTLAQDALWHGFAVFLRVTAMVALLPAFGETSVPARIKLIVALGFTLIVAPAVAATPGPNGSAALPIMVLTETLAGLALGLGVRLFILALQTAGAIAAQSTSLSQLLGGAAVEPLPAIGYVLIVGGLALAVMTGLHIKAAALLILSYDLLPQGRFVNASVLSEWGLNQVRVAFSLAFTLAAPFVILSVLYNLALGAINKAMPQLMVAFVGAPVITAGGLLLLCLSAPMILSVWLGALDSFLANPFGPQP